MTERLCAIRTACCPRVVYCGSVGVSGNNTADYFNPVVLSLYMFSHIAAVSINPFELIHNECIIDSTSKHNRVLSIVYMLSGTCISYLHRMIGSVSFVFSSYVYKSVHFLWKEIYAWTRNARFA